ncbi:hypothetical protein CRUP_001126, partial [Coryphaenoides rupestris]
MVLCRKMVDCSLRALGLPAPVVDACPLIPSLEKTLEEIMALAESGIRYTQMPHIMEVVLPMLCSYMSHWWEYGPENNPESTDCCCTSLRWEHMNALLGNILKIIYNNLGIDEGTWMKRLAVFSQPIISKANAQLLKTHFLPLMEKLKKKAAVVLMDEEHTKAEGRGEMSEAELLVLDEFTILGAISDQERKKLKRKGDRYTMQTSLIVATLKRML